jgi:hypothetical protein
MVSMLARVTAIKFDTAGVFSRLAIDVLDGSNQLGIAIEQLPNVLWSSTVLYGAPNASAHFSESSAHVCCKPVRI